MGCCPQGCIESDTLKGLSMHACIGEGNGNPLQHSCLENLRDGGAWWAAIYGVTQSQTRLKRLSSSSSSPYRVTTDFTVYNSFAFSKRSNSWNHIVCQFSSVQFISVAQSCPTLCDPMNRSMPGPPVHHQLPEFTQTHVHRLRDAIQPSHPGSSCSPPATNPSQHQSLFQ